jgi:transcriptional regulator with XRE-family HTH domain
MAPDPNSSPLAFFGAELKRLRQRAGITQTALAESTNYALATVSAFENGTRIPSREFAESADKVFGTDGDLTRLQGLVEAVSVRPWFRDRVEVERKAITIREYDSYQVPGLLQTEEYARAVISAGRPMLSEDEIGRAVALRMTRQLILEPDDDLPIDREQTPRLWTIMDESALHRIVGAPEVMRAQRDHLAAMAQRPNITIQIIPLSEGATCAYGRAFTILTSANNSSVVYLEDVITAHYVRDRDQVAQYALRFDHLCAAALNDERSLKLIRGEDK